MESKKPSERFIVDRTSIFKLFRWIIFSSVFWILIRDPGLGAFLTPGSGIRDEQPGSYFLELRNHFLLFLGLKYLNSLRIRDPGWRQSRSGMEKSRIRDPG
jgi:hypothetical protein